MRKDRILKRLTTMIASAALAVGLLATSVSASGLPDASEKGSITVHKLAAMGESTTNHDGTEITDTSMLGTPLAGAKFSLYKVDPDADIDSDTDPDTLAASSDATLVSQQTTPANGVIVWDELDIGYYVLVEDEAPAGYEGSVSSIITLPFGFNPDPGNDDATTEYNYNVHVYPKNVNNSEIIKTVTDEQSAYVVGDTVSWEIGAKIDISKGLYDETPYYGSLKITDPLDERLTYTAESASLTLTGGSSPAALTVGTHYTETITTDGTTGAQTVEWDLTNAGLELAQGRGSTGITVNISTVVNSKAQNSGTSSISNTASINIEYLSGDEVEEEVDPDTEPEILLGGVIIDKTNYDESEKLANAKFKLALTKADAEAGVFVQDSSNADIEVTTDSNGYAQFVDFSDVSPAINWENVNTFYLVETQAPAGYIKKQAAVEVVMSDDSDAAVKIKTVTVLNQKPTDPAIPGEDKPTFQLPLTGGIGTVLFIAVGLTLIIGAVAVLRKNRKAKA